MALVPATKSRLSDRIKEKMSGVFDLRLFLFLSIEFLIALLEILSLFTLIPLGNGGHLWSNHLMPNLIVYLFSAISIFGPSILAKSEKKPSFAPWIFGIVPFLFVSLIGVLNTMIETKNWLFFMNDFATGLFFLLILIGLSQLRRCLNPS